MWMTGISGQSFRRSPEAKLIVGGAGEAEGFGVLCPETKHLHNCRSILLAILFKNVLKMLTKNSPGDDIANSLYDDIVHVLQHTIDSCINCATDRGGYVLERMFTKFSEITQ